MTYIDPPLTTDGDTIATDMLDRMMSNIPGWIPREGHVETWVIEAIAHAMAIVLGVASRIPKRIFRYYGESLIQLVPIDGANASCLSTWTMVDDAGYTIYAGTTVAFRSISGVLIPFVTVSDVVIEAGETVATDVEIVATTVGTANNGLAAQDLVLVDSLASVDTVVSTTTTTGGVDPETEDEYLDRLVAELQLLTPRPILAKDFAVYARRVPGVVRAAALDNYNPADDTFGNEKMVTVAVIDAEGLDVSAGVKTDVEELLEAAREINFIVNVVDPERTDFTIAWSVKALLGYDADALRDSINAAVTEFVSPITWGASPTDPLLWEQDDTLRYLDVAGIIHSVPGVDHIILLTINGGTVDVVLDGRISLPNLVAVDGTVT